MKVLRVGMTYPRDIEPGVGLHSYYHSFYSNNEECILTSVRPGKIWQNREGVEIHEIGIRNRSMGEYGDGTLKRILLLIAKVWGQITFLKKAKPYINSFNPDIIHLYTPIPILCGIYARRKCNSKIVVSLHGSDALRISKDRFLGFLLRLPDAVVSVSENSEVVLSNIRLNKKIICIGNGVDLEVFKNQHLIREKQLIHVANLRWQKGQEYLLQAFARFVRENPNYKLIIIGEGELRDKLQALCTELKINDNVVWKGTKGREYIANELNKSRAFVLTSVTEGFPKVVIEAMATGTPVISTDVGNVKSVVGESGIIVEPRNIDKISEAMLTITSDDNVWAKDSQLSEEKAQNYSWENHVQKLQSVYEEVLNG